MANTFTSVQVVTLLVFGVACMVPLSSFAIEVSNPVVSAEQGESLSSVSASVRFNNTNWFTSPHPEPASFVVTSTGETYGTTTNGIPFIQVNVENSEGIRIQKFVIQDHYHYIVEGEIAYTLEELSQKIAVHSNARKQRSIGSLIAGILGQ